MVNQVDSLIPITSNLTSVETRGLWILVKWYGSEEILRWKNVKFSYFFANCLSSFGVMYLDKFSNIFLSELICLKNSVSFDTFFFTAWVNLMFLLFKVWMKSSLLTFKKVKYSLVHIMQNHFDFWSFWTSLSACLFILLHSLRTHILHLSHWILSWLFTAGQKHILQGNWTTLLIL